MIYGAWFKACGASAQSFLCPVTSAPSETYTLLIDMLLGFIFS